MGAEIYAGRVNCQFKGMNHVIGIGYVITGISWPRGRTLLIIPHSFELEHAGCLARTHDSTQRRTPPGSEHSEFHQQHYLSDFLVRPKPKFEGKL